MDSKNLISMISVILAAVLVTATVSISAEAGKVGPAMKVMADRGPVGLNTPQVKADRGPVGPYTPQVKADRGPVGPDTPQVGQDIGRLSIRKPGADSGSGQCELKASSKIGFIDWLIRLIQPFWSPDLSLVTKLGVSE